MRSNYRRVGGYGDLLDDFTDLFKSESEIVAETSDAWNQACPPGASRQSDGSCKETSCPPGYIRDVSKGCVRYTPTATLCPTGLFAILRGDGTHDCMSCPPGQEPASPHDPRCVASNPYGSNVSGGASLSAGGSVADFFANLLSGGASPAPVSTGGGTVSPGVAIPKTIPGTSYAIPDKSAPVPTVVGTPAFSNLPTALLVLGAVGLVGGGIYLATR